MILSLSYDLKPFDCLLTTELLRQTKNMCVSGYMLLKIRVGRLDFFFIFEIILFPRSTFCKNRTGISTFFGLSCGVTARSSFIFIG